MAEITDVCLVTINGQQATVNTALKAGLLAKDAQENYYDPTSPGIGVRTQVAAQHRPKEQRQEPTRVDLHSQDNRKSLETIKENMGLCYRFSSRQFARAPDDRQRCPADGQCSCLRPQS